LKNPVLEKGAAKPALPVTLAEFRSRSPLTLEELCRRIYRNEYAGIIKKEEIAVPNLVKIIRAVTHLSKKQGYHAMSLRDLSRHTGLSMGGLYAYFSGKDDLLRMLFAEGKRVIHEALRDPARDKSALEKLRYAVCAHLFLSESIPGIFRFFFMEAGSFDRINRTNVSGLEEETENIFTGILEEGVETGEFHRIDPALAASVLKSMLQSWYLKRSRFSRRKVTVEDYASFVLSTAEAAWSLK